SKDQVGYWFGSASTMVIALLSAAWCSSITKNQSKSEGNTHWSCCSAVQALRRGARSGVRTRHILARTQGVAHLSLDTNATKYFRRTSKLPSSYGSVLGQTTLRSTSFLPPSRGNSEKSRRSSSMEALG